jgi:hypothetical protein
MAEALASTFQDQFHIAATPADAPAPAAYINCLGGTA